MAEIQTHTIFMHDLVGEENHSKIKALEWSKHFSHCKSLVIFPEAQGQLTPQSDTLEIQTHPGLYFMDVPVTCKNNAKNEGARVVTNAVRARC